MEITVHFGLQDGLPQGLGLWAQQGGPEHVTGKAFLRHLRASIEGQMPSDKWLHELHKKDYAGLKLATSACHWPPGLRAHAPPSEAALCGSEQHPQFSMHPVVQGSQGNPFSLTQGFMGGGT